MLYNKKSLAKQFGSAEKETPIDFAWLIYIGMNKLGFTFREVGYMTLGLWTDLFETYKKQYNFEMQKRLFNLNEEEKVASLLSL